MTPANVSAWAWTAVSVSVLGLFCVLAICTAVAVVAGTIKSVRKR